jgi:hypothetical protein
MTVARSIGHDVSQVEMNGAEISCCRCGVLLMERRAWFRSSRTRELREAKQSLFGDRSS